ncbi:MAG: hypothetical protein M9962_04190 [Oligoflexia bacterium]|nr:hypothetical protein [Oligoflexia bacterium]
MKSLFILPVTAVLILGCKANDAIDATIGMKEQMSSMLTTTKEMQEETKKLNSAIHLQKLDAALKTIYAPENTKAVVPPSSGLMAGAKVFAEEATALELVEYTYVTLKEVDKTAIREGNQDYPELVKAFNHEKLIKILALQAIAAQTPESTVLEIVNQQISGGGGRYEDYAYNFLMLRAMFLLDFYLDSGVLSGPVNNMGKLEKAYEYLKAYETIANFSFADRIGLKTVGFMDPQPNFDVKIDPKATKLMWKKLVRSIERDMPAEFKAENSPYLRRIIEIQDDALRTLERK